MKFNENSRVKIPKILHLMRLGYKYLSLKDPSIAWDESMNIFTDIFPAALKKLTQPLPILKQSNALMMCHCVWRMKAMNELLINLYQIKNSKPAKLH